MNLLNTSIRLILFASILSLMACGGEKTESKGEEENTETTEESTNENTTEAEEPESSTNTEKVGFEKMLEALFASGFPSPEKPKILQKDIANGYVEFEVMQQGTKLKYNGQIGYFITNSGKEFLATALPSCMQACEYSLMFFEMENGKITSKPTEGFIEGMSKMNEFSEAVFQQMRAKMTDAEKQEEKKGNMGLYDGIIKIPQQGTTITFEKISNLTGNQKVAVAELKYNVETGTFKFVKK